MSQKRKRRIHFSLYWRVRDHGDCLLYERCLDAAAKINAPRVCWEGCPMWFSPKPGKAKEMAEVLENFRNFMPEEAAETYAQQLENEGDELDDE